jgi:hypothetical protein
VGRSYLAFAMLVLLLVSPAFGQYVSVIQACSRDITDLCAPAQPGGGSLVECIKAHFQDFTETLQGGACEHCPGARILRDGYPRAVSHRQA